VADKSSFAPDEWKQILGGVMLTGLAVTTAEPSGLWGMLKESIASGSAVLKASTDPNSNGLVKAVVADFQTSEGRTTARDDIKAILSGASSTADAHTRTITALKTVGTLLDTKAPADAAAFKAWLQAIGEKTANAANEGGFLGWGGVAVSDAEKVALDEISKALNPPGA
jgi:hypothetical protein